MGAGLLGGRRSEIRGQKSEGGGQKAEVRGRRSEIRDLTTKEIDSFRSVTREPGCLSSEAT